MAAEPVRSFVSECPDLETLAAYLDGRVADNARAGIAEHLATCESCYFIFSEAAQLRVVPSPPVRWWKSPRVVWPAAAAGLAAAATLVLAVSGVLPWPTSSDTPGLSAGVQRELILAVNRERTIEPRLTGGFSHAPLRGVVRSGTGLTPTLSPELRIAAASIEKEAGSLSSPEAQQIRGIASLVTLDVERAVMTLEQAATERPNDPRILSDLSAAYLVRGERTNNPQDLSKGLATVNRALTIERTIPEALFNRAVALERMSMTPEAIGAWQAYLTVDDRSGWADEARAHLSSLGPQP